NLYRSQATPKLELVADTNTDNGGLEVRRKVYVLGVGTQSVYVGALGQGVGVTQAVNLLLLQLVTGTTHVLRSLAQVTHGPGSHNLTSTNRSTQANGVVVNAHAILESTQGCSRTKQVVNITIKLTSNQTVAGLTT